MMSSVKGKGERILLSSGESSRFPAWGASAGGVREAGLEDRTGTQGSPGLCFQPRLRRGSAEDIGSLESLQWELCIPKPGSSQTVSISQGSVRKQQAASGPAKPWTVTTEGTSTSTPSSSPAPPFLTLHFAAWNTAVEGHQPTCRAIAWPFSCIFYPSLNPWALCAGATSHMLKMLKSKHFADCTSMRSQRGSEQ